MGAGNFQGLCNVPTYTAIPKRKKHSSTLQEILEQAMLYLLKLKLDFRPNFFLKSIYLSLYVGYLPLISVLPLLSLYLCSLPFWANVK